jgi:hypothetical protein
LIDRHSAEGQQEEQDGGDPEDGASALIAKLELGDL